MKRIICFQSIVLVVIMLIAFLVERNTVVVVSAAMGGLSYLIPTIIMGLIIKLIHTKKDSVYQAQISFVVGESSKILFSIVLMVLCIVFYSKLAWIWFFISFVCVSKFIYFVTWKLGHYGSRNRKSRS